VTICFSIKKSTFIVTGTDALAENTITHTSVIQKKFLVNPKRNFVVLFSGSFLIDKPAPEPRELLVTKMDEIITKNDTMLMIAKKLSQLMINTYKNMGKAIFDLQICGFDSKFPHIYAVSNRDCTGDLWFCLTGAPDILDYGNTKEAQNHISLIGKLVPFPEIIQKEVRKFVTDAITYENKTALSKGEKPKTGGGINIVTVSQNNIIWSDPRADSKDDIYQIGIK
jgi:hypothetical protein